MKTRCVECGYTDKEGHVSSCLIGQGFNFYKEELWWTCGSGRIEIHMTKEQAESVFHSGHCDADVAALIPQLKEQLDNIHPLILAAELKEYGCWNDKELANHADNLERLVWIAGSDLAEQQIK